MKNATLFFSRLAFQKVFMLLIFLSTCAPHAFSQVSSSVKDESKSKTVTGKVVDSEGEPLIGVTIAVVGSSIGTTSNGNGTFSLKTSPNAQLRFSYIGYTTQTITVGEQSSINVTLSDGAVAMKDVVVTALGIKREKKMLGYSIQEVKGDDLVKTGDPSVINAMQGKVAGMQISTAGTGLSGSTKITIRGNTSLSGSNQPLWIVDGVPFNDNSNSDVSLYGGVDRGGASADINPEDIETISVLKGPSAAALYGSRAGNGVILITTKKGVKKSGFGVTYNNSFTWTQIAETLNMQTLYGQGINGTLESNTPYSFGAPLDGHKYTDNKGVTKQYKQYGNKLDDYFNTGFSQIHNVSVGGVTETSNYRLSIGNLKSDGLFQGETLDKINLDLKAGMTMNKFLSVDTKVSLSRTKAENRPYIGKDGQIYQLLLIPNNVSLDELKNYKTETSEHVNWYGPDQTYSNPYYLQQQRTNMDDRWRAFGYYSMKLNFTPWLYGTAKYAFDYYRTKITETDLTKNTNGNTSSLDPDKRQDQYSTQEDNFFESNAEFMLIGNNTLSRDIRIGYSLGANRMDQRWEELYGKSQGMLRYGDWHHNSASATAVNEYLTRRRTNSVFGTFQFAYKEYLSADLTARNDWSSTLPPENNSYFYPSVNLAFIASEYFKNSLPTWVTFAKGRLSFAQVGKDTDPYRLYNYTSYKQGFNGPQPISDLTKANNTLKPEISTSYEAGLDLKFLQNRLGVDFTYYTSLTKNQIMTVPISGAYTRKYVNAGEISNNGIEMMIYTTPIKSKDIRLDVDVNLSHNTSTVKKLYDGVKYMSFNFKGEQLMLDVGATEGGKLGDIYGTKNYKRDNQGRILVDASGQPLYSPIDYTKPIGNIQPYLMASINPQLTLGNVSLSAMIDSRFGGDIVSLTEAIATTYGTSARTENRENFVFNGIIDGTNAPNTAPIEAENYYRNIGGGGETGVAEEFIYDASFVKFKELSIAYTFPRNLLKKTPLTSLRLSFVARNLGYIMKHTPGTSPEGGFDTSMFSQAIDFTSIPYSRTYGFSANLSF